MKILIGRCSLNELDFKIAKKELITQCELHGIECGAQVSLIKLTKHATNNINNIPLTIKSNKYSFSVITIYIYKHPNNNVNTILDENINWSVFI